LLAHFDLLVTSVRFGFGFTITNGKILGIDVVADPERLHQLELR
jgi:hypothetical protein